MKKTIKLLFIILLLLSSTACANKEGQKICTMKNKLDEATSLEYEYVIDYKNDYVTRLKTTEIIKSTNKEDLNNYKETLTKAYEEYNNIKYYHNNISVEDNSLISSTIINYEKIDINKLLEVDSSNKNLIKNNKVLLKDIVDIYKENGCICK